MYARTWSKILGHGGYPGRKEAYTYVIASMTLCKILSGLKILQPPTRLSPHESQRFRCPQYSWVTERYVRVQVTRVVPQKISQLLGVRVDIFGFAVCTTRSWIWSITRAVRTMHQIMFHCVETLCYVQCTVGAHTPNILTHEPYQKTKK